MNNYGSPVSSGQPVRRKSSNLLGSLGRSSTLHSSSTQDSPSTHHSHDQYYQQQQQQHFPAPPPPMPSGLPAPATATAQSVSNLPSQSFAAALEQQRQLMQKRLESWTYLKRVCAADQSTLWFNTVALLRQDIEGHLNNKPGSPSGMLQKRTIRFMVLGLNLSPLLDQSSSADFLKGLLSLSQDFDQLSDDSLLKPRMKSIFKPGSRNVRARSGTSSTVSTTESITDDAASHLYCPNIPFDLDYFQTFFTLADIFVEIYAKILSYFGSPSSPNPSLSQSRSAANVPPPMSPANLTVPQSQSQSHPSSSSSSSSSPSPPMVDTLNKIDAKLRKVPNAILKELDGLARQCIRDELAGLDQALCGANGGSTPDALLRRGTMSDE